MQTLIHADIFFFVTTVLLVVIGVLFIVALSYVISILRDLREFLRKAAGRVEPVLDDLTGLHSAIRKHGLKVAYFLSVIGGFFDRKGRKHHEDQEEE